MLFLLKILLTLPWRLAWHRRGDWFGLPDTVLTFPVSTYVNTATHKDANITLIKVEKYSPFTSFVFHTSLPKRWSHPFFPYSPFLRELVFLTTELEDIRGTHPKLDPKATPPINNKVSRDSLQAAPVLSIMKWVPCSLATLFFQKLGGNFVSLTLIEKFETSSPQICFPKRNP